MFIHFVESPQIKRMATAVEMVDFRKPGVIMRKQNILLDANLINDSKVCVIKLNPREILGRNITIAGKFEDGNDFKEIIHIEPGEELNFKIDNPDYSCDFLDGVINIARKDNKKFSNALIAQAESNGVIGILYNTGNRNYVR